MMRVGLQAAAVANGAASLANMFCPMVPRTLVPKSLLGKANSFVDGLDKPSNVADSASVHASVESGDGGGKAKRGGELRDFEIFLDKHDTKQVYAGLRRVCNEENGEAIWTTDASVKAMEEEPGATAVEPAEQTAKAVVAEAKDSKPKGRAMLADMSASLDANQKIMETKIDQVQATALDLLEGQTTILKMSADTQDLVKKSTSKVGASEGGEGGG